jgi:hypothetical protein
MVSIIENADFPTIKTHILGKHSQALLPMEVNLKKWRIRIGREKDFLKIKCVLYVHT